MKHYGCPGLRMVFALDNLINSFLLIVVEIFISYSLNYADKQHHFLTIICIDISIFKIVDSCIVLHVSWYVLYREVDGDTQAKYKCIRRHIYLIFYINYRTMCNL